jgi:hypothetical protein
MPSESVKITGESVGQGYLQSFANAVIYRAKATDLCNSSMLIGFFFVNSSQEEVALQNFSDILARPLDFETISPHLLW